MKSSALMAAMLFVAAPRPAGADAIDAAFAAWSGPDRPGCAVAIRRGDAPAELRAYGMADLERGVPVSVDTVFETGSVAKQVTAAATLLLVEEGRLSLADDIRTYLPEMPDYGTPITIDQLLTHTSGLRDWSDLADFTGWPRYTRAYSNLDALMLASRQRALNHSPGTRFAYTNTGYNLLAIIVERASGESLATFSARRIFAPLGMTHSSWRDDFRRIVPKRAIGYIRDDGTLVIGLPMENAYGSGGMLTTAGDLSLWLAALDSGRLGPFVTARLTEPTTLRDGHVIAYGRGLELSRYRGQREIFHNGGTYGYQAWAGRYPDARLSIAMLCNGRSVGPDTQAHRVADLWLPAAPADASASPPPADELRTRPGLYVGDGGFQIIDISAVDGRLQTARGNPLAFLAPGRYGMGDSELRFTPGGLEWHRSDGDVRSFTRETRVVAAPTDGLAGRYVNDEVGGVFDVALDGDGLRITPPARPEGAVRLSPLFADGFLGPDYLVRVRRDAGGRVSALRFQTGRVYALDFVPINTQRGAMRIAPSMRTSSPLK